MAADVSTLVRMMGYKEDQQQQQQKKEVVVNEIGGGLITRDLLGGCSIPLDSKELDLDLQVPSGWEKRLDLTSGKVYLQRCDSPNKSSSSSEVQHQANQAVPKFQDLNFPPAPKKLLNFFGDASLDLNLVVPTSSSPTSSNYQSVCTLDKVKSALERAEKETNKKQLILMSNSPSSPSNASSSTKETEIGFEENSSSSFAACCPSCSLFVLISKSNPRCPRCNSIVPSPKASKKPRIDLNF